jgi:hypothetical protein
MREVAIVTSVKGRRSVSHHSPRQRAAGARWSRHTSSTERPASIRSNTIRSAMSVLSSHSAVARAVAKGIACRPSPPRTDRPRRVACKPRHGRGRQVRQAPRRHGDRRIGPCARDDAHAPRGALRASSFMVTSFVFRRMSRPQARTSTLPLSAWHCIPKRVSIKIDMKKSDVLCPETAIKRLGNNAIFVRVDSNSAPIVSLRRRQQRIFRTLSPPGKSQGKSADCSVR